MKLFEFSNAACYISTLEQYGSSSESEENEEMSYDRYTHLKRNSVEVMQSHNSFEPQPKKATKTKSKLRSVTHNQKVKKVSKKKPKKTKKQEKEYILLEDRFYNCEDTSEIGKRMLVNE